MWRYLFIISLVILFKPLLSKNNIDKQEILHLWEKGNSSEHFTLSVKTNQSGEIDSITRHRYDNQGNIDVNNKFEASFKQLTEERVPLQQNLGMTTMSIQADPKNPHEVTLRTLSSISFWSGPQYREDKFKIEQGNSGKIVLRDPLEDNKIVTHLEFDPHLNSLGIPNGTEVIRSYTKCD